MAVEIRTIGSSGQISLGKRHAGRTVTVDQVEEGVWVIKASRVIPENELWLQLPAVAERLSRAIDWAEENAPAESDLGRFEKKLGRRR